MEGQHGPGGLPACSRCPSEAQEGPHFSSQAGPTVRGCGISLLWSLGGHVLCSSARPCLSSGPYTEAAPLFLAAGETAGDDFLGVSENPHPGSPPLAESGSASKTPSGECLPPPFLGTVKPLAFLSLGEGGLLHSPCVGTHNSLPPPIGRPFMGRWGAVPGWRLCRAGSQSCCHDHLHFLLLQAFVLKKESWRARVVLCQGFASPQTQGKGQTFLGVLCVCGHLCVHPTWCCTVREGENGRTSLQSC